jgi:predicted MFS family arabinose efflux permease
MYPKALNNIEFRKLLLAQLPADFADWLDFVAIGALLACVWDAPSIAYAFLAVGLGAPYLIIGPFAGVLVDRLSIRATLIWSNLGRAVVTGAFFLADDWPALIALVAVRSSVDSFFTPAKQAAIQALTSKEGRASANGLSHGINQASKIVAPGVGGAFLIWFEPNGIFVLNAVVSALAALLALRLHPIVRATNEGANGTVTLLSDARAGLDLVRQTPVIRAVVLIMAASYFAMFIYDTFIAPLTHNLGFEPQHLGYALAAVGSGGVVGSVLFALLGELNRPQAWIAAGSAIAAVMLILLGGFDVARAEMSLVVLVGIFSVLGFVSAMSVVPVRIVLQNTVPESRMGSVTAISEAANTTAMLSAPFIGAILASTFSVGAPFVAGGVIMLGVALIALRTPST